MEVSKSLLFLALAGASGAAVAANAPPEPKAFVEKAAQDGLTEVKAAKIALTKSQDPRIRSFAERMVEDHGRANAELAAIAKTKGIDAPADLDATHQKMIDALAAKAGSEFDREYSHHMIMDHLKAIELFESATKSADADLAAFAKKTLPTLKQHKQLAEKLPGANGQAPK